MDLLAPLVLSVLANAVLGVLLYRKKPQKSELSLSAEALLAELLQGQAIVRLEVVDRAALFLRRPRG